MRRGVLLFVFAAAAPESRRVESGLPFISQLGIGVKYCVKRAHSMSANLGSALTMVAVEAGMVMSTPQVAWTTGVKVASFSVLRSTLPLAEAAECTA